MSKYQIVRHKNSYLIRRKDKTYSEWHWYQEKDASGSAHWWYSDEYIKYATKYDILSDALETLAEIRNPYEVIYPPKKWWQIWRRS